MDDLLFRYRHDRILIEIWRRLQDALKENERLKQLLEEKSHPGVTTLV